MFLLNVDQIKLFVLNIIMYLYLFLYYCSELKGVENFLRWHVIKSIEWLIKSLIILVNYDAFLAYSKVLVVIKGYGLFKLYDDEIILNLEGYLSRKGELILFKEQLIVEWNMQAEGLTEANFYEKNYKNLEALNLYVKQEISNKNSMKPILKIKNGK